MSCAVALKVLEIYESEHANQRAKEINARLKHMLREEFGLLDPQKLKQQNRVVDVRGLGIMIAVALEEKQGIGEVVAKEMFNSHRVICQVIGSKKHILLLVPPLSTTDEQVQRIVRAVKESVNNASKS